MHTEKVFFENRDGHKLAALLDRPMGDRPIAYALLAHCFTCSKNYKGISHVSRALTAEGIAVLRFDFTGLGESEGEFSDTNFSSNVADLVAAAGFMDRRWQAPSVLVGHSLGGTAMLQAASHIASARAVATIAAPSSPRHLLRHLSSRVSEIERVGEVEVDLGGRPFRIKRQLLDDIEEVSLRNAIRGLDRALLVLHSPLDKVVGIDNATEIFSAARHPKSFVSLDSADHLLSDRRDAQYVGKLIAGWAQRYIGEPQETRKQAPSGDNRIVTRTPSGGFRTDVLANGHPLVADEPEAVGGTNAGPSPYELLAAALGSCTTMTLVMYAARKGWPLEAAEARLRHARVHCEACADPESPRSRIDHFSREIVLFGPLDEAQRRRLLEIADLCPVQRTLHTRVKVTTTVVGE